MRIPARVAAASLFAVAMMLGACAAPSDVEQFIADAQVRAEAVEVDLRRIEEEVGEQVPDLPDELRGEVVDAVGSAQAATEEARSALEKAANGEDDAVVALSDAQVALDAASAEVKHAKDTAAEAGSEVADSLQRLQEQIDALRGETSRAAS
jgi:chromosome segregation ATPase